MSCILPYVFPTSGYQAFDLRQKVLPPYTDLEIGYYGRPICKWCEQESGSEETERYIQCEDCGVCGHCLWKWGQHLADHGGLCDLHTPDYTQFVCYACRSVDIEDCSECGQHVCKNHKVTCSGKWSIDCSCDYYVCSSCARGDDESDDERALVWYCDYHENDGDVGANTESDDESDDEGEVDDGEPVVFDFDVDYDRDDVFCENV